MSYYLRPVNHSRNKMKLELDLSNYATKSKDEQRTGQQRTNGLIQQHLLKKADLVSLKSDVDNIMLLVKRLYMIN